MRSYLKLYIKYQNIDYITFMMIFLICLSSVKCLLFSNRNHFVCVNRSQLIVSCKLLAHCQITNGKCARINSEWMYDEYVVPVSRLHATAASADHVNIRNTVMLWTKEHHICSVHICTEQTWLTCKNYRVLYENGVMYNSNRSKFRYQNLKPLSFSPTTEYIVYCHHRQHNINTAKSFM